jgi:hypothetical protein
VTSTVTAAATTNTAGSLLAIAAPVLRSDLTQVTGRNAPPPAALPEAVTLDLIRFDGQVASVDYAA